MITVPHSNPSGLLSRRYGWMRSFDAVFPVAEEEDSPATLLPLTDPNRATEAELAELPVIGEAIAKTIVAERRRRGRFANLEQLKDRVAGLGERGAERLEAALDFLPAAKRRFSLEADLNKLVEVGLRAVGSPSLADLLDEVAAACATAPHPATRFGHKRADLEPESAPSASPGEPASVRVLLDHSYRPRLLKALGDDVPTIDVCMFFMALGGEGHGTRALVDTLIERSRSGVAVRVLLDRDDVDDPYGSRVVNQAAAQYLIDGGVTVHVDAPTSLLHSKFVLLGNDLLFLGSHNWTAGSYDRYRDVSFEIRGPAATTYRQRFDDLWSRSQPFSW